MCVRGTLPQGSCLEETEGHQCTCIGQVSTTNVRVEGVNGVGGRGGGAERRGIEGVTERQLNACHAQGQTSTQRKVRALDTPDRQ